MTILITGASSGIGAACARKFAEEGHSLILLARRQERLQALKKFLSVPVHLICQDVADAAMLSRELSNLPERFQGIDVLINCAGVTLGDSAPHLSDLDQWQRMVDTNINGLIACTRLVLPGMVQRNRGLIINIGSTAGSYPRPGNAIYCASKAFSKQFSLALRADLAGSAIRVTSIEPGTVKDTELALGRLDGDVEALRRQQMPYDYLLPRDVAETAWWISRLPGRVNINRVDMMATCQTFSHLSNNKALWSSPLPTGEDLSKLEMMLA
ncbi:SDR family NAD(P)-dependent oxidoreductase [Chromobacterium phragmitis]|uniref:SDR family NAD(P)-dependent oxidoreductase n=1 Tax=Chromobacterium amazonense TaxID=1382803 RepID=UPI0021B823B1|nr:SDR family NAD(P)-dependent oxidoreductase [Chromobacterium amazonense]MBM2883305.1 SDR family NAD(P)-dependent oxidoreductase [Chromobacterium amazonense]MDE1712582.1 SDR family NAD(P)-dependent oxidoreductase [Chromobacterium amazonense]